MIPPVNALRGLAVIFPDWLGDRQRLPERSAQPRIPRGAARASRKSGNEARRAAHIASRLRRLQMSPFAGPDWFPRAHVRAGRGRGVPVRSALNPRGQVSPRGGGFSGGPAAGVAGRPKWKVCAWWGDWSGGRGDVGGDRVEIGGLKGSLDALERV